MSSTKSSKMKAEVALVQPYEIEVLEAEIASQDRFIGDVAAGHGRENSPGCSSAELWVDADDIDLLRGSRRHGVRKVRPPRQVFVANLADELAALINVMNSRFSTPFIVFDGTDRRYREIPRGSATRIVPNRIVLPLDLRDFAPPLGAKRQTLWTLLTAAGLGRTWMGSSRRATIPERRRGTLGAPLSFGLIAETHTFYCGEPVWGEHHLVVSCEETDRVPAIRQQVALLCEHLSNPANLSPLSHPFMMI